MLEQSILHGKVYCVTQTETSLQTKAVALTDISFGPMRPIHLYVISDMEIFICDINKDDWYHYKSDSKTSILPLIDKIRPESIPQVTEHFYYYGQAKYKDEFHTYFIKNMPRVTISDIPDVNTVPFPITLQTLDYEETFTYPDRLRKELANIPACYTDRYKRPIKRTYDATYPISIDKVTTKFIELPMCTYPVVLNFANTIYGIADLEPHHTEEDITHFNSLDGYYVEDTPRGGKHKLVKIESPEFKFRYSDGLEIINQSQATLYGINGTWLNDNPNPIDVTVYKEVGHTEHEVIAALDRPNVEREVELLQKKAIENLSIGKQTAERLYRTDADVSHGEYMALWVLYRDDILPYAKQLDRSLLPWILERYAMDVIEHRSKHETMRHGLPYLVYLSAIIIERNRLL